MKRTSRPATAKTLAAALLLAAVPALSACGSTTDQPTSRSTSADSHVGPALSVVKERLTSSQRAALAPVDRSRVTHARNRNLSPEAAQARFETIDAAYDVGQAFDPADAEFVRAYASPDAQAFDPQELRANPAGSTSFNRSASSGTKKTTISGKMTFGGGPLTWTWTLSMRSVTGSAITKQKLGAHVRAYGIVGQNGIGTVYQANPSFTTTDHNHLWQPKASYHCLGITYFTMYADAVAQYSGGSYTVTSG